MAALLLPLIIASPLSLTDRRCPPCALSLQVSVSARAGKENRSGAAEATARVVEPAVKDQPAGVTTRRRSSSSLKPSPRIVVQPLPSEASQPTRRHSASNSNGRSQVTQEHQQQEEEGEEEEEDEEADDQAEYAGDEEEELEEEEEEDDGDFVYDQQEDMEEDADDDQHSTLLPAPHHTQSAASSIPSSSASSSAASSSSSSSSSSSIPHPPHPSAAEVAAAVAKWQASLKSSSSSSPHDYSSSILSNLRESESLTLPSPSYMDVVQGDLSFPMRSILLDWLVEVAAEYHLQAQTIFLCVAYVDRFLAQTPIDRRRLQLVGITCMLIAAKYWEIYPPTIDDFVYISDHTYDKEQVLDMERAVLTSLKFQLTTPTAWEFGRRLTRDCAQEQVEQALMDYLLEAFVQEPAFLHHRPSVVAASACYLAMSTNRRRAGGEVIRMVRQHSSYEYRELKPCVHALWRLHERLFTDPAGAIAAGTTGLKAVKDKYSTTKLHQVSSIAPRDSIAEIR